MFKVTKKHLKLILNYKPETGSWRYKIDGNNQFVKKGKVAGTIDKLGYHVIKIKGKSYKAHRLAFLFMEGYFPENDVDHINGIRDDNRWVNLREVSRGCNIRNSKLHKNNTSEVKGVYRDKRTGFYTSKISYNKKEIYLGYYKEIFEAVRARYDAEIKYSYSNCNTTSSAYLYLKEKGLL